MAFQCESNDLVLIDSLEATGLFGRWEIADEVTNGVISDMLPKCCEFLEFDPDDDITDSKGLLNYTDSQGLVNRGTFEVDIANQTILFVDNDNDEFTFEYSLDDSQENLTIASTEGGANLTQVWVRIE
jgi:hypothetical protein